MSNIIINPYRYASSGDPYWSSVSLLLHFDGSDGSPTFTDSSSNAHTVTASGNAQIDTADSQYGGASGLFDGTSDYISIASHTSLTSISGEFTLEFWMKSSTWTTDTVDRRIISWKSQANADGFELIQNSANVSKLTLRGNSAVIGTTTSNLSGAWHHIAITRNSSNRIDIWVDGATEVNATNSTTFNAASNIRIGTFEATPGQGDYLGWLDELRFTKGVCRYTTTFTPSGPFPDS